MTQFVSLSSGSNGNCYYIGNECAGILIDAGIGTRTIKKRLGEVGIPVERIRCVLVSHDHFDHIRSLGTFAERFHKPVYATAPCIAAFNRHYCTRGYLGPGRCHELVPGERMVIEADNPADDVAEREGLAELPGFCHAGVPDGAEVPGTRRGIYVLPFRVPHDATDTVGFFIDFFGETFTFLTDLGAVTEDAVSFAARSRHLIVEANYDPEMLRTGSYPPDLQQRIRSGHGHLANAQTAELILRALALSGASGDRSGTALSRAEAALGQKNPRSASAPSDGVTVVQDVFLCHLSENNNTPELALATVSAALASAPHGTGINLFALPRHEHSPLFTWQ